MGNPNNPWAFGPQPPPPPQGYAPPPPPPPKGLFAPPQGKRRGLALAMVCAMALAQLASAVMANIFLNDFVDGILSDPLQLGLAAANLLIALLVFLKCVLPGWEPHRKIFGWLLGAWAVGTLAGSIYGSIQAVQLVGDALAGSGFGIAGIVGGAFGALYGIVISPQGILLFGILAKKSTEKIAGLVSAISCGFGLLSISLLWLGGRFLTAIAESGLLDGLPESLMSNVLLPSPIVGLVLSLCWAIFCLTWPVLERPVLEVMNESNRK